MKRNLKLCIAMLLTFICVFTSCGKTNKKNYTRYINESDFHKVLKEAFLTDKGYTDELSKHISSEVFQRTNIYNTYNVNAPEYKKPFKVDFNLKEESQSKVKDLIYVKMIYSVSITDSQGKVVGGSRDIPVTYTVEDKDGNWYITHKEEEA